MIDIQQEWDFIVHEVHYNNPQTTPYQGNDRIARELLFMLQTLLPQCKTGNDWDNFVYQTTKEQYLKIINPHDN